MISPRTILVADSGAGLIWRVDLPKDGGTPVARVWLRHESMADDFCIDAGIAYLTTHRDNTIDCVSLNPKRAF